MLDYGLMSNLTSSLRKSHKAQRSKIKANLLSEEASILIQRLQSCWILGLVYAMLKRGTSSVKYSRMSSNKLNSPAYHTQTINKATDKGRETNNKENKRKQRELKTRPCQIRGFRNLFGAWRNTPESITRLEKTHNIFPWSGDCTTGNPTQAPRQSQSRTELDHAWLGIRL